MAKKRKKDETVPAEPTAPDPVPAATTDPIGDMLAEDAALAETISMEEKENDPLYQDLWIVNRIQKSVLKDMRDDPKTYTRTDVRLLTDLYVMHMKGRIRISNQISQLKKKGRFKPHSTIDRAKADYAAAEHNIKTHLRIFAEGYRAGRWMMSICGVGPVVASGLLAHLDIRKAKHMGSFWRFAGLVNEPWQKGQKRPWNGRLKTLVAFIAGESFVKVQRKPADVYGKLFAARKKEEFAYNRAGGFVEDCKEALKVKEFKRDTWTKKWYEGRFPAEILDDGWYEMKTKAERESRMKKMVLPGSTGVPMLPPGHLHARARRYAAKIFLGHVYDFMYEDMNGSPAGRPLPWVFEHMTGHMHFIPIPNYPFEDMGGRPLIELPEY